MPQPIGEYRGCTILLYNGNRDPVLYGNSCTAGLRYTIDRVKQDIDAFKGDEPEPTGDYWAYHSTYRGIEIKVWMPGSKAYGAWVDNDWVARATLSALKTLIDASIESEPPAAKKPTTITIDVSPTSGTPPYDVMITVELTSNGAPVPYKSIRLYKNDVLKMSKSTLANGMATFTDTVTAVSSYYAYFAGDSEYEGCSTDGDGPPPGAALGGLGLLVLAALILRGGK